MMLNLNNDEDLHKILDSQPWCFNGNLLALKKRDPERDIEDLEI